MMATSPADTLSRSHIGPWPPISAASKRKERAITTAPAINEIQCPQCKLTYSGLHPFCPTCGTSAPPTGKNIPVTGALFAGKYRILGPIGSGAMGSLYRAEQTQLSRTVAIKLLHPELLHNQESVARFRREARAASQLDHPNCVRILDFDILDSGQYYIAMEYIEGIDLADLLHQQHPLPPQRIAHIAQQICLGLDEAHAHGVLHRDLKLENVMISARRLNQDHVTIVDFGIAKLEDQQSNARRTFQTRIGIVCGTPEYMSPEQARGQTLDARSDLYALGVLLYHVITNKLPFDADSAIDIITMHVHDAPPPIDAALHGIPQALADLVMALLSKDPNLRPQSAMDIHAELERISQDIKRARQTSDELVTVVDRPAPHIAVKKKAQPAAHAPEKKAFNLWLLLGVIVAAVATGAGLSFL